MSRIEPEDFKDVPSDRHQTRELLNYISGITKLQYRANQRLKIYGISMN